MGLRRHEFDKEYVQRLIAAEPETERHFTLYFGELLTLKLRSRLRSAAQMDDAKQETFVRVLRTLKQKGGLSTPESLGAFVNGVCNNVLFEFYRSDARTTALDQAHDEQENRPGAEAILMAVEERDTVREALAALPQRERDLLRWLFFEERDKDEICRQMNIDRNYLRVLVHRAKTQFRAQFISLSGRASP